MTYLQSDAMFKVLETVYTYWTVTKALLIWGLALTGWAIYQIHIEGGV